MLILGYLPRSTHRPTDKRKESIRSWSNTCEVIAHTSKTIGQSCYPLRNMLTIPPCRSLPRCHHLRPTTGSVLVPIGRRQGSANMTILEARNYSKTGHQSGEN